MHTGGGFEVQANGNWSMAPVVAVGKDDTSVIVTVGNSSGHSSGHSSDHSSGNSSGTDSIIIDRI